MKKIITATLTIVSMFYSQLLSAQCTSGTGASGFPTVTLSNSSICSGNSLTVTIGGAYSCTGSCEFLFLIKSGVNTIWSSGPVYSTSYTFTNLNSTGTYDVYSCVRGYGYCSMIESNNASLTITAGISGPYSASATPSSICAGDTVTLSGSPSGGNTIRWYDNVNATGTPVGTGNSIEVNPTTTTTYYAFGYNSSSGCISGYGTYQSATVTVNGYPPNCGISSSNTGTTNNPVSISSWFNNFNESYSFVFQGGANPSSATGAGAHSVTWGTTGTKNVLLTVTNTSTGCTSVCNKNIVISYGCPSAIINAPTKACTGLTNSISAVDMGPNVTYSWNFGYGASPATATGIGPHSVSYSTAGYSTITLTVSKSGCSTLNSNSSIQIGNNFTQPVISGSRSVYINTASNFSTASVSGASYNWGVAGASQSGGNNSVDLTWSTLGSKIIDVTVTNGGCIKSDTHLLTVVTPPCYMSNSNFSSLPNPTYMQNKSITDAANTTVTFNATSFTTFSTGVGASGYPRGATQDTAIAWWMLKTTSWQKLTIDFTTYVNSLSFSVRDVDRNGGADRDSIYFLFYTSNDTLDIDDVNYTTGISVNRNGKVFYPLSSQVNYNDSSGDISIAVPTSYYVNKVEIYRRMNTTNGSSVMDIGVSDLDWCTSVPLPVQFMHVDARLNEDNKVTVNWSTASEQNNSFFDIERSSSHGEFSVVGTLNSAGNSNSIINYSFIDNDVPSGELIYRIKQTDFDGKFAYSKLVNVSNYNMLTEASVTPNPFNGKVDIKVKNNNYNGEGEILISSIDGKTIFEKEIRYTSGISSLDLSFLSKGIYYFRIIEPNGISNYFKMIKQ